MELYIFGNGNLSFGDFVARYATVLETLDLDSTHFIVCDFRGADTLSMEYLKHLTPRVRVFHVGDRPRYLSDKYRTKVSGWELVGGFDDDVSRDDAAIEACTHFLAFDQNTSAKRKSGTQRNIERCLELRKMPLGDAMHSETA